MSLSEVFLCLSTVVISCLSQISIKFATLQNNMMLKLFFIGISGGCFLGSIFISLLVLRTIHLSELLPFTSLSYIFIPILGHKIFNDKLSRHHYKGAMFLIVGIIIVNI